MFEEKNYWKGVKKGGKMHIFRPINLYLENCKKSLRILIGTYILSELRIKKETKQVIEAISGNNKQNGSTTSSNKGSSFKNCNLLD